VGGGVVEDGGDEGGGGGCRVVEGGLGLGVDECAEDGCWCFDAGTVESGDGEAAGDYDDDEDGEE